MIVVLWMRLLKNRSKCHDYGRSKDRLDDLAMGLSGGQQQRLVIARAICDRTGNYLA